MPSEAEVRQALRGGSLGSNLQPAAQPEPEPDIDKTLPWRETLAAARLESAHEQGLQEDRALQDTFG